MLLDVHRRLSNGDIKPCRKVTELRSILWPTFVTNSLFSKSVTSVRLENSCTNHRRYDSDVRPVSSVANSLTKNRQIPPTFIDEPNVALHHPTYTLMLTRHRHVKSAKIICARNIDYRLVWRANVLKLGPFTHRTSTYIDTDSLPYGIIRQRVRCRTPPHMQILCKYSKHGTGKYYVIQEQIKK